MSQCSDSDSDSCPRSSLSYNAEALMCLEGKIEPPSMHMDEPEEMLDGPREYGGFWRRGMRLRFQKVSRMEFREANLTPEEMEVATPREISEIMRSYGSYQRKRLDYWRVIWSSRIKKNQRRAAKTEREQRKQSEVRWKGHEEHLVDVLSRTMSKIGLDRTSRQSSVQGKQERQYVCACKSTPSVHPCLYCVPS